jgi:FdhD protein
VKSEILRINLQEAKKIEDSVVEESWVNIYINKNLIFSTTCLFEAIEEFTYGFLKTEGIIRSLEDVKDTKLKDNSIFISIPTFKVYKRYRGEDVISLLPLKHHIKFSSEVIINIGKHFDSIGELYKNTGGTHISALYNLKGECLIYFEDINRRNVKIRRAGIPIIISKSAPTDRAIETAHKLNVTMIGFLRVNRFNQYNNFENLILN